MELLRWSEGDETRIEAKKNLMQSRKGKRVPLWWGEAPERLYCSCEAYRVRRRTGWLGW
jgi:hypothetical protein